MLHAVVEHWQGSFKIGLLIAATNTPTRCCRAFLRSMGRLTDFLALAQDCEHAGSRLFGAAKAIEVPKGLLRTGRLRGCEAEALLIFARFTQETSVWRAYGHKKDRPSIGTLRKRCTLPSNSVMSLAMALCALGDARSVACLGPISHLQMRN